MRGQRILLAAAALAAVVGLGYSLAARGDSLILLNSLTIYAPEVNNLGGLTYRDGKLWAGDVSSVDVTVTGPYDPYDPYYPYGPNSPTDRIVVHEIDPSDGTVLSTHQVTPTDFASDSPGGLGEGGDKFYASIVSSQTTGIAEFGPSFVISRVLTPQGIEPVTRTKGVSFDDRYVWHAHYSPDQGHLYAISPADNKRVNDLAVDPYPYGLSWDGRSFWVAHHTDAGGGGTYLAQYDRAGHKLASYDLPAGVGADLADITVVGDTMYALEMGQNVIYQMQIPSSPGVTPLLPPGLTGGAVRTATSITYGKREYSDTPPAVPLAELPTASSLRRAISPQQDVLALARAELDGLGQPHHVVHALAYGDGNSDPLEASAQVTITKQIEIEPGESLAAGKSVMAKGQITLTGLLALTRDTTDLPDAQGLLSMLSVEVRKRGSGGSARVFSGYVGLKGLDAPGPSVVVGSATPSWARLVIGGDLTTPEFRQSADASLYGEDDLVELLLEGVSFDFRVPAQVGESFNIDIIFKAEAGVPRNARALGAEAVFGEDPLLYVGYAPPEDPTSYDDSYLGQSDYWRNDYSAVPEPVGLSLLGLGLMLVRRRGQR